MFEPVNKVNQGGVVEFAPINREIKIGNNFHSMDEIKADKILNALYNQTKTKVMIVKLDD